MRKIHISNVYWEVLKVFEMLLVCVCSMQYGNIRSFWCMKTWYSSKIFMYFINLSNLIFWSQNVLIIPPDQNVSIPPDQNMSILLVNNISIGILEQFGTENYTWRLDITRILLSIFCQILLSNFANFSCLTFCAQNVQTPKTLNSMLRTLTKS